MRMARAVACAEVAQFSLEGAPSKDGPALTAKHISTVNEGL